MLVHDLHDSLSAFKTISEVQQGRYVKAILDRLAELNL
jgi:hypothetical protein